MENKDVSLTNSFTFENKDVSSTNYFIYEDKFSEKSLTLIVFQKGNYNIQ